MLSIRSRSSTSGSSGSRKASHETGLDFVAEDPGARIKGMDYGQYSAHVGTEQRNGANSESGPEQQGTICVRRETNVS